MIVVDEKLGLKEKVSSVKEQLQEGNFKSMVLKSGDVEVGTLYLIYGDSKGFEIYFVAVPNATPLSGVDGIVTRIELSFVDKTAKVERNLKEVQFSSRNIEAVFEYMDLQEFEKLIDDEEYPNMMSDLRIIASHYFGRRSGGFKTLRTVYELPLHDFFYGIVKEYGVLEVLYKAGLNLAPILKEYYSGYCETGLPFFFDLTKKKPHQILRMGKAQFNSLKNSTKLLERIFRGQPVKVHATDNSIDIATKLYWDYVEHYHFQDSDFISKLREMDDRYSLDILEHDVFNIEGIGGRFIQPPKEVMSSFTHKFNKEIEETLQRGENYFSPNEKELQEWCEHVKCRMLGELYRISEDNNLEYLRLIEYIYYECHVRQGITYANTAKVFYRDYLRMQKKLLRIEQTTSRNIVKYPKSLKLAHDVTAMNYNVMKQEIDKAEWKVIQDSLNELEWEGNKYVVLAPKEPRDLVEEGSSLHHCVSSYVDSLLKGRTKVMFLRDKKEQDKSLVTLEIKNGILRQAYGLSNRETTTEQDLVLQQYAKSKGLELNYK